MPTAADIFREISTSPTAPWNVLHALSTAPQGQYEPDLIYRMRTVNVPIGIQGPPGSNAPLPNDVFLGSPASRAAAAPPPTPAPKPGQAAGAFPNSFKDPAYNSAEAYASKLTGVPADLLARVRMLGERSNADQVNQRTGASTPYQITASTRQGIMKNYGIDPWSSPQNAALGSAYVLWEQAGRPKPGGWSADTAARAVGGYFGGAAGAANPFGTISDGNNTVGQYTQRVLGPDTKLPFPALNPYDQRYDRAAMGQLDAEQKALMTPSHFSVAGPGPAPELPKPEAIPTTDFSASDAALADMKPVEITAKEQMQIQRKDFFQGLAQAMANSPGNEGLGTFLMHLGAGALAGKAAASDEIKHEQDKFDDKMARYQAAVYQNDLAKAQTIHQEATAQVAQNNQFARDNWTVAYDNWKGAGGSVNISGTNAVVTRKDTNGNITVDTLPIASAVGAAMAQQRANLFSSIGGRVFAGNQQIAGMANSLAARAAIQQMNGGPSKVSDAAAAAAPAMYATWLTTHGGVGDVIGADGLKSLEQSIQQQIPPQITAGSKEWIDRHDNIMANELTKLAVASPDIMKKMMAAGSAMPSQMSADALSAAKTRTATDARGQTTTSTTAPAAADIFSSEQFNQDLADHGYSRY